MRIDGGHDTRSIFLRGKVKARFVVPILAAGALLLSATTASAAPAPVGSTGKVTVKDAGLYAWCTFQGEKPFQLTHNGGLIAQGHYTGCSTPAPDKCRAQVDLQRLEAYDGHWHAVKHKNSGWTKCSGRVTTKPLKCVHDGHKETYNTQVTLQVEYHGRFSEPGIADSHNTYVDC
ncbi:hypothetical protein [Streptomyces echinatus]|uniref:hypothetical protein n=1 Tax=Streptomyces echinatus TaxID=67293 RepID=UPI001C87DC61|nr:hypothetical protein [Streptomyces echinatus]